jgi:limonene-1,2-epoxide hydrolase
VGTKGWYYKVATAGTTSIDGIADWAVGDWIVYNGTVWDKVDNTDTAFGKQFLYFPAGGIVPRATNGATGPNTVELATNKIMVQSLDFDHTTQRYAQVRIKMPKQWDHGTITYMVVFSQATTSAGGVTWGGAALALSDGDASDTAFGTQVNVTKTAGVANTEYGTAESGSITIANTPISMDELVFQITRVVADAGDTLTQPARLEGLGIWINTTIGNDG